MDSMNTFDTKKYNKTFENNKNKEIVLPETLLKLLNSWSKDYRHNDDFVLGKKLFLHYINLEDIYFVDSYPYAYFRGLSRIKGLKLHPDTRKALDFFLYTIEEIKEFYKVK